MNVVAEHPYVFQSGRYKDKCLESVFVENPLAVSRVYRDMYTRRCKKVSKTSNELQLAMDALQEKIKNLDVTQVCPVCHQEKVHFFLIPDHGYIQENLVTCQKKSCQESIKSQDSGELYVINDLLLIISYMEKKEAKKIIKIFRNSHSSQLMAELW